MHKKQVAILDVGSSKIRAVVGERGVNNTFIIKGDKSFKYEGFEDDKFFDVEEVKSTVLACGEYLKNVVRGGVDTVYVGVPSPFTQVLVRDCQISFDKKKKITEADIENLYDAGFVINSTKQTLINRSAIMYELNDYRRLSNPVGVSSEILRGKLSFILCNNYFIEIFNPALVACGFKKVEFVSTSLSEVLYLCDVESRCRMSLFVDVGYISSTFTIVQGDGIVYERSFNYGGGYITAALSQIFNVNFEDAENLKRKVNLSQITSGNVLEVLDDDNGRYYNIGEIKQVISRSLDDFCEEISKCLEQILFVIPDYIPLRITGGGIAFIRGAKEHVANRLAMAVETVVPNVPLMDNPLESSCLSLLDIALQQ